MHEKIIALLQNGFDFDQIINEWTKGTDFIDRNYLIIKLSGFEIVCKELCCFVSLHSADKKLCRAILNGRLEIVKYLFEQTRLYQIVGSNELYKAARFGHLEILKYFVDNDIKISKKNNYILEGAIAGGNFDVVKYLVEDCDMCARVNDRIWFKAMESGHREIIQYLAELFCFEGRYNYE